MLKFGRVGMKIGVDVDEVVAKFFEGYLEFVSSKGIEVVPYDDVYNYKLWEVLDIEKDLAFNLALEYGMNHAFVNNEFVEGARDGVLDLIRDHDVYFITARPVEAIDLTRKFICGEFGVSEDRVIFSGESYGGSRDKYEICRGLGIGMIVEDSDSDSLSYAERGLDVVLLDKPWNRWVSHDNIYRCKDWNDILDKVGELVDGG